MVCILFFAPCIVVDLFICNRVSDLATNLIFFWATSFCGCLFKDIQNGAPTRGLKLRGVVNFIMIQLIFAQCFVKALKRQMFFSILLTYTNFSKNVCGIFEIC